MPKFTIFWLVTYVSGLLASFVQPVFGVYTYLFEYYLRPPLHWWGKGYLPLLRWNFIAAAVASAAFILRRGSLKDIGKASATPGALLVALAGVMMVVQLFAVNRELSWLSITEYLKLILFHGLIVGNLRSVAAFDGFIAMHMLGAGWWGFEAWRNPRREAGRLANVGSGDTWSDNFAAAHLLTVIPFIVVYLLLHKDKRLKAIAGVTAPFVINVFILCNSRGATVGLLAGAMVAVLIARSGHRIRMLAAGAALAAGFFALADPEFIARQQTTTRYEEDGSAQQRFATWQGGLRLLAERPLGTGGKGYEELSPVYVPEVVEAMGEKRAPHNTFVLVASEWGIQGLFLYLSFQASLFYLARQVRKRATSGDIWYYRAVALEVSMVAMLVSSMFSDRLYGEAPYWIAGLVVALHRLQTHELAQRAGSVEPVVTTADPEPLSPIAAFIRSRFPPVGSARG